MPHKNAKQMRDFISRTDKILFEEWDPIGINNFPEASDEYSSYAPGLLRIAMRGNVNTVADQLHQISSVHMGLSGNSRLNDLVIAQKLVDLASQFDSE